MRSFLFPTFSRAFFRGLHTSTSLTWGLSKSCSHAAQVPSSKVTCKLPHSPWINWRMVVAFVSTTHSITSLPVESRTAAEIVAWCTSNPIYLASFIRVLLSVGVDANDQTLLQRGALLYCVGLSEYGNSRQVPLYINYVKLESVGRCR